MLTDKQYERLADFCQLKEVDKLFYRVDCVDGSLIDKSDWRPDSDLAPTWQRLLLLKRVKDWLLPIDSLINNSLSAPFPILVASLTELQAKEDGFIGYTLNTMRSITLCSATMERLMFSSNADICKAVLNTIAYFEELHPKRVAKYESLEKMNGFYYLCPEGDFMCGCTCSTSAMPPCGHCTEHCVAEVESYAFS